MDANTQSLLDFIQDGAPFEIPIYQRGYSWDVEDCLKLWEDAKRVGRDKDPNRSHFVGVVIYTKEKGADGRLKRFVIDGQQRLATVTLLIEALARSLDEGGTVDGLSAEELRNRYILNPNEFGDNACRLLLNKKDRETLKAVLDLCLWPDDLSLRLQENFDEFMFKFDEAGTAEQAESMSVEEVLAERRAHILNGLRRLKIVAAELDREREDPQIIFENMNTKKRPLTKSDLIRNYVLLDLDPADQTELYKKHWRPMEEGFEQKTYANDFDDFIRYYLAFKNSKLPGIKQLYDEFQNFAHERIQKNRGKQRDAAMKEIVADVQKFAGYFCKMKLEKEENPDLKRVFKAIQELKANTLFPLLLGIYDDYAANCILSAEQFEKAGWILESYIVRRIVCGLVSQGQSLAQTVPKYYRLVDKNRYVESLGEVLRDRPTSERFPDDGEFQKKLNGNIGSLRPRGYFLKRLEDYESDAPLDLHGYEVERIMPQIPKGGDLSEEWKRAIGPDWEEPYTQFVDNLGNLTLMEDRAAFAQESFSVKRGMYRNSPLWLNTCPKGPGRVEQWNPQAIQERAKILMEIALEVWPTPWMPEKEPTPPPNPKPTPPPIPDPPDLEGDEAALWNALTDEPQYIDAIAQAAGLPVWTATTTLLNLELKGLAKQRPGMRYIRIIKR